MSSKNVILISETAKKYPTLVKQGRSDEHIDGMYDLGIFVWNDIDDATAANYEPPEPYYKYKTGKTSRPYIPLTQDELNYILTHQTEIEIVEVYLKIKSLLTSRQFEDVKLLLPKLSKLNKQDYSEFVAGDSPMCILLRWFKIETKDDERSLKNSESTNN